jgi:ferredoxin
MVQKAGDAGSEGPPRQEIIDRQACMGSGNCVYWAPEVFDLDDEGVAIVFGDLAGHEERVRLAAANCPTAAIHLEGALNA